MTRPQVLESIRRAVWADGFRNGDYPLEVIRRASVIYGTCDDWPLVQEIIRCVAIDRRTA